MAIALSRVSATSALPLAALPRFARLAARPRGSLLLKPRSARALQQHLLIPTLCGAKFATPLTLHQKARGRDSTRPRETLYITNCYNHVASFCEGSVCICVHRWCNMVGVLHRGGVTPLGVTSQMGKRCNSFTGKDVTSYPHLRKDVTSFLQKNDVTSFL